jgi:hypothetical protein
MTSNYISNPGFETGHLDDWTRLCSGATYTCEVNEASKYTDTYGLDAVCDSTSEFQQAEVSVVQNIGKIEYGQNISFRFKSLSGATWNDAADQHAYINIYLNYATEFQDLALLYDDDLSLTHEWIEVSTTAAYGYANSQIIISLFAGYNP